MLKIITRTALILLAAGLVCASLYLFVDSGMSQSLGLSAGRGGEHNGQGRFSESTQEQSFLPSDGGGLEHTGGGDYQGFSWDTAAGLLQNAGLIALVTAAVALLRKITARRRRKNTLSPA
ncbi:MAG: hypothetical protein GYA17_20745 [Chloroflexi bacterium]|nr:hypothetical protein [Anaerolineaceae bacterium]NMB90796.1 hypothetical protein [Chloroflexota bacterium]